MVYNKTLFEELGIETVPTTYEELKYYTNDYWMQFGQDLIAYCQGCIEANDVLANMDQNRADGAAIAGNPDWA